MARNAYVAMVEKAFLDYIGSVKWDVTDRDSNERVDSAYKFMRRPNPQSSFRDTFSPSIRDLFRYDAGAIVKTFNRRRELVEMRPYLGTEFWIEMDRSRSSFQCRQMTISGSGRQSSRAKRRPVKKS